MPRTFWPASSINSDENATCPEALMTGNAWEVKRTISFEFTNSCPVRTISSSPSESARQRPARLLLSIPGPCKPARNAICPASLSTGGESAPEKVTPLSIPGTCIPVIAMLRDVMAAGSRPARKFSSINDINTGASFLGIVESVLLRDRFVHRSSVIEAVKKRQINGLPLIIPTWPLSFTPAPAPCPSAAPRPRGLRGRRRRLPRWPSLRSRFRRGLSALRASFRLLRRWPPTASRGCSL